MINPKRGEIWQASFRMSVGQEINKDRPVLVISPDYMGLRNLWIVVPIVHWKKDRENWPWFVMLTPDANNGLSKKSGADGSQVQSIAKERFIEYVGKVKDPEVEDVTKAVALCIGFDPSSI